MGVGPPDFINDKVKKYVEDAITDFIKANFDL